MINKVHIKNFKSIKDLEFDCSRVNIFIGEPNTGKSNILEAIGIFTLPNMPDFYQISRLIRIERSYNIFFNENTNENINIKLTENNSNIFSLSWSYYNGNAFAECINETMKKSVMRFELSIDLHFAKIHFSEKEVPSIKFYKFIPMMDFNGHEVGYLRPPNGNNLPQLIRLNNEVQEFASSLFEPYGYKIEIDLHESLIKIYREGHIGESLPYFLTSDTLQRILFYETAIKTNNNCSLLFEEPEAHIFPFYSEQLALSIKYSTNQFFVTTHNPHFLYMLLNKMPPEELNVFKVYYENYQTYVKLLDVNNLLNLLINDNDILLNINQIE